MEGKSGMDEEIHGEWQKVSARNRPFNHVGEVENEDDCSDDSYETGSEDDIGDAVFLETKIEIMDTGKAKEKAKPESDFAPLALI